MLDALKFVDSHPGVLTVIVGCLGAYAALYIRQALTTLQITILQELRATEQRINQRIDATMIVPEVRRTGTHA